MGPVAAHLAAGVPLSNLGPPAGDIVPDNWKPAKVLRDGAIRGKVVYIDRFGNCITNIAERDLASLNTPACMVVARDRTVPLGRTFADAPLGDPLAYLGSAGFLEIAVNMGSAAELLQMETDDPVTVSPQ